MVNYYGGGQLHQKAGKLASWHISILKCRSPIPTPRQLPVVSGILPARTPPVGPGTGFPPSRQLLWKHTPAATELPRLLFIEGALSTTQSNFSWARSGGPARWLVLPAPAVRRVRGNAGLPRQFGNVAIMRRQPLGNDLEFEFFRLGGHRFPLHRPHYRLKILLAGGDIYADTGGRGGKLLAVPPRNTSRTCPACGHVAAENRQTQARFACVECGFVENADLVGAINVLRAGHARLK